MKKTITLDEYEQRAVKRGLFLLVKDLRRIINKNEVSGWIPKPGKIDADKAQVKNAESVFEKLG